MESTIQTKQPNQNLCPTMVRRYTMVTPGSPRKQSISVSFLSPASYAMMTSRVQDTQWLRLDPPGNNPYPQARLSQALALLFATYTDCRIHNGYAWIPQETIRTLGQTRPGNSAMQSREKKNHGLRHGGKHSSITSGKPKIRENNIDRMNPRCGHKADIKQKALSISLLRKYLSYSTFQNHFQISYLYKVHYI